MPPPAAAVAHALLLLPPATPSTSPPKLSLSKGPSTHLSLVNPCFGIAPLSSSFRRPIRCSASVAEASAPASETVVRARRPSPAEVVRTIMELSSTGTLSAVTQEGWPLGIGARFVVDGQGMPALCLGQHADGRFAAGSRSSFHVQLEQNGSRTPQCTVLGNLGKPDDSFLIKKLHASWEKKFGEELDTNLVYVVSVERVLYMENFKEDGSWITSSEYINADPDPLRNFAARLVDEMNDKHMEDVQRLCNVYVDAEFQVMGSKLIWVDRLGFDVHIYSEGSTFEARIPFPREVSDEKGVKSSFNCMSHLAWEIEKNYVPADFEQVKILKRIR